MNPSVATRVGLAILAALGASLALYFGRTIFIPVVFAGVLTAMLLPAVGWMHRHGVRWGLATFAVIFLLILANITIFFAFATIVPRVLQQFPRPSDYAAQDKIYLQIRAKLELLVPERSLDKVMAAEPAESANLEYVRKLLNSDYLTNKLVELGQVGGNWIFQSILILFVLLFLLLEGRMLADRVKGIFGPSRVTQSRVTKALIEMAAAVQQYMIWRTLVNIGLGIALGVVYSIIGLSEPWTWGLFTMVLCYVPYIGTLVAGVPPVLDAFFTVSPTAALFVLCFFILVVTLEGYIIIPVVMGRSMSLNATTVLLSCLYWDLVWGTPGLFLAMPMMAALKAVLLNTEGYEPWGHLLGTEESSLQADAEVTAKELSAGLLNSMPDTPLIVPEPEPLPGRKPLI